MLEQEQVLTNQQWQTMCYYFSRYKIYWSYCFGDEIIGFTKIQKITNSMVFLICHLECKGKLIATASGIWKILKKPLPNAGFGG